MTNILISSAGRRAALVKLFQREIQHLQGNVFAADVGRTSAACRLATSWRQVPHCTAFEFPAALRQACDDWKINWIVPTIDTELPVLANLRTQFAAEGINVAVSSIETIEICSDKFRTADFLERSNLPTVATLNNPSQVGCPQLPNTAFPVFLKPAQGSSSIGAVRINDQETLNFYFAQTACPIVQEHAVGREFTVNFFVDRLGRCIAAVPHERLETRAGEVSKCVTRHIPALEELAWKIAAALPGAYGPLCYQAFYDRDAGPRIIEINARFGGGYPVTHAAGANFVDFLLNDREGTTTPPTRSTWAEGCVMLRYDAAVFTTTHDIEQSA